MQSNIWSVFDDNENAVVRVFGARVVDSDDAESGKTFLDIGTGFFISGDGHVLTSATVVYRASRVWVEYQGVAYAAEVVGSDTVTSISIIRLLSPPEDFKFIHLNDSVSMPRVGTFLLAVTCKHALDPAPTLGLVTGWHTQFFDRMLPTKHIRTDIPSDGGDTGSPVFDLDGRCVGIMVATLPEIRSSFIIPVAAALRIRDDLVLSGKVTYGYMGIDVSEKVSEKSGVQVLVKDTLPGSPGEKSGLMEGDILLSFNENPVKRISDLHDAAFFARPNQIIPVEILRNGQKRQLSVRVAQRPEDPVVKPSKKKAKQESATVSTEGA